MRSRTAGIVEVLNVGRRRIELGYNRDPKPVLASHGHCVGRASARTSFLHPFFTQLVGQPILEVAQDRPRQFTPVVGQAKSPLLVAVGVLKMKMRWELRLEATRRPELRRMLTTMIRSDLADNVDFHRASGHPSDTTTVTLLYLALNWLILDRLTLPGVFGDEETDALIAAAVDRLTGDTG